MMTEKEMLIIAQKEDFEKVVILDTDQLVFRPEYRACCEDNSCGNYDRNYGCPPDCGTPQEMEDKAKNFANAMVFQTRLEVDDPDDKAIQKEIKKEHGRKTRSVVMEFQQAGIHGKMMLPGPCTVCKECGKIQGKPCLFPEKQTSCLSAYGVDVSDLAQAAQMQFEWSGRFVSYFSVFLFGEDAK